MGCVSSKSDINDQHPNIFQVSNVNDQGDLVSPGQLEVTETELVLYQRGKNPTIWPLRALRKYGFDTEIFSFECGRRCPTGQGIYAFRCRKAEQLFNIVQRNIVRHSNDDLNPLTLNMVAPNTDSNVTTTAMPRRLPPPLDGYFNNVSNNTRGTCSLSRPNSVSSNGPVSPTAVSPPIPEIVQEHNNNKRASIITEHSYSNANIGLDIDRAESNYTNVDNEGLLMLSEETETALKETDCHLYINIDTNVTKDLVNQSNIETEDLTHSYANIDTKEIESVWSPPKSNIDSLVCDPNTPTTLCNPIQEVNYAELDLESINNSITYISQLLTPESPNMIKKKSYATIDFQKTNALSQSINPPIEVEEGSRKTRHNSTMNAT